MHLYKLLERRIRRHLVVDPIRRNRVIRYILHVRLAEVQRRVEHGRRDAPDRGMFFPLNLVKLVDHTLVMDVQFVKVVKDVVNELVEPLAGYDGRFCGAQGADVHLA